MDLAIVGSLAYDDVETPSGKRDNQLGGSAIYASLAASRYAKVGVIGVVGNDFTDGDMAILENNSVDTSGVERVEGESLHWRGHYLNDINMAETLETRLNVFEQFKPKLKSHHTTVSHLFLANIDPELQLYTLNQMQTRPKFVACDTMNLWIGIKKDALREVIQSVDALFINEAEAESFSNVKGLPNVAEKLLAEGLKYLIIKRGEYGAVLFTPNFVFSMPAYPIAEVKDPTGAGDSFAGGFIGCLAQQGEITEQSLRQATVAGSVMASVTVSEFGTGALQSTDQAALRGRYEQFYTLTNFDKIGLQFAN